MKIIKSICDFIGFIFKLILILILMLVIHLVSISVVNKMEYAHYKETGIMKNGNLCISHMCITSGYQEKYYNSDNSVLQETEDFYVSNGIKLGIGNWNGDVLGKVYKPINSGTSDIYVEISKYPSVVTKDFELYHVEVDKDLNITYNMKKISKEKFEENTGENS